MTVTTSVNKVIATGDAIQVDFPHSFIVLEESHMNVYLDGVLEDTANWSWVSAVDPQDGGTVTMATAPGVGVKVTLLRIVPNTQLVDYSAYGSFPAETHERALDLRVMEAQQLQEAGGRALKAPLDDESGFDYSLPTPAANKGWKINATNDAIILTTNDPDEQEALAAAQVVLAEAQVALANTARTGAQTAQGLSEDARDASVVAKDASVVAKDASVVAQGLSEDAQALSEAWAEGTLPGGVGTKSAKEWAEDAANAGGVTLGSISGLTLSNNVTDALKDIDIAIGQARDSTDAYTMELPSGLTKQLDATWAVGTNAGGLFSGTVAADTWYHIFLIRKDSDGSIDVGFDTSISAANIPAGYTAYQRLGSILTDVSSNILGFVQHDNLFYWKVPILDFSGAGPTARATKTLSVPPGVRIYATMFLRTGQDQFVYLAPLDVTDLAGTPNDPPGCSNYNGGTAGIQGGGQTAVLTDTSAQVGVRCSTATTIVMVTQFWEDRRVL